MIDIGDLPDDGSGRQMAIKRDLGRVANDTSEVSREHHENVRMCLRPRGTRQIIKAVL